MFVRSLQWRSSNHDCFLHTQLHTRLTEFLLLLIVCFAYLYIVQHKQSNERRSWSKSFVFSLSYELYCDFIVVCAFAYLSIAFFSCLLLMVYLKCVRCICRYSFCFNFQTICMWSRHCVLVNTSPWFSTWFSYLSYSILYLL